VRPGKHAVPVQARIFAVQLFGNDNGAVEQPVVAFGDPVVAGGAGAEGEMVRAGVFPGMHETFRLARKAGPGLKKLGADHFPGDFSIVD
jgi:hypothetical protein